MKKLLACVCRIECEEIKLSDGSTVLVCVGCETYIESDAQGRRPMAMSDKPLRQVTVSRKAPRVARAA